LLAADYALSDAEEAARVAGVDRPRLADAPVFGTESGAPPIDFPLPEKALKPAAAELLLAAASEPFDSSAEVSRAVDGPALFMKEGRISPPQAFPAVMK